MAQIRHPFTYRDVGDIFTFMKSKNKVKKRGKVSKSTRSIDFIDQSVDTFLDKNMKNGHKFMSIARKAYARA